MFICESNLTTLFIISTTLYLVISSFSELIVVLMRDSQLYHRSLVDRLVQSARLFQIFVINLKSLLQCVLHHVHCPRILHLANILSHLGRIIIIDHSRRLQSDLISNTINDRIDSAFPVYKL